MENKLQGMKAPELIEKFGHLITMLEHLEKIPAIIETLDKIEKAVYAKNMDDYLDSFLPFDKAIKALKISNRHYYTLRKAGAFPRYIRIGSKTYFTRKMINEFMDSHTIHHNNK